MVQAARQAETESDIVRRLVARPLRVVMDGAPLVPAMLTLVPPSMPHEIEADEDPSPDLLRLKTEMTLMKAVLKAERSENAELRSRMERTDTGMTVADDAQLVRDRWATLVDQLLRKPR